MTDSPSTPPDALLDFTPVLRKIKRPDGWTPDLQREFIRRVALNGSPQQTCTEMGKHVTGVEALYKVPGADSFRAAWDEAVRIGRSAQGLDCGPPHLGPVPGINRRPPRNAPCPSDLDTDRDEPLLSEEDKRDLLENIFQKFVRKVGQEREARLAGRIIEADFTLRQITCIEIALDLTALRLGTSGWEVIREARMGEHNIFDIAETDLSRCLDDSRRAVWEAAGDPPRPEHPPRRYLVEHDGYSSEPNEFLRGGSKDEREAQIAAQEKQHREDAEAQAIYENSARAEWAARARPGEAYASPLPQAGPKRGAKPGAWRAPPARGGHFVEDEADIAMREALAIAREAHPEDFD